METQDRSVVLPSTSGFNYPSVFPHMWDGDKVPNGTETARSRVSWAGVVSVSL